jgi:hypothetical protein
MMSTRIFGLVGLVAVVGLTAALPVATADVHYGDFGGSNVDFLMVQETVSTAGDVEPLFGAPQLNGDGLQFRPSFSADSATNSSGIDATGGKVWFQVDAKPGWALEQIEISEDGTYSLFSISDPPDATVAVSAFAFVRILETDQWTGIGPDNGNEMLDFGPDGNIFQLTATPFEVGSWSGSYSVNLADIVQGTAYEGQAIKRIEFALDNMLLASSTSGSANISKTSTGVQLDVVTAPIPEPTTGMLGLMGVGLAVTYGTRRRGRKNG